MDNDGFILEKISEKSNETYISTPKNHSRIKVQSHSTDDIIPTVNDSTINGTRFQLYNNNSERNTSIKTVSERISTISKNSNEQILNERNSVNSGSIAPLPPISLKATTIPNYDTVQKPSAHDKDNSSDEGGDKNVNHYQDGDELEVHQLSVGDIDAYLDIYFETLNNRLKHLIGGDQKLIEFRNATKERLKSDQNSREYQTVLLGKIGGDVLAAITMIFNADRTTITRTQAFQSQQRGCLTRIHNWMISKANYIPTYSEECYIEMIGVKANYRRQGIGAAMLECAEHFARKAGARWLTIHVQGNLRDYFERFGFDIDPTDHSPLWKWLIERQSTEKMNKSITAEDDNDDEMGAGG